MPCMLLLVKSYVIFFTDYVVLPSNLHVVLQVPSRYCMSDLVSMAISGVTSSVTISPDGDVIGTPLTRSSGSSTVHAHRSRHC